MKTHWVYEMRRAFTTRRLIAVGLISTAATVLASASMAAVAAAMSAELTIDPREVLVFVLGRGSVMPVVAGITSAVLVGAEYRYRTVELTLSLSPRRGRVVAAYFMGQALLASTLGLSGAVLVIATVTVSTGRFEEWVLATSATGVHVFTCAVWSMWAVSLVLLTRSRGVASLLLLIWAVVVEPAINGVAAVVGTGRGVGTVPSVHDPGLAHHDTRSRRSHTPRGR